MPTPSDQSLQSASVHAISLVSERTGLTSDTIRVWERRYAAVTPERSAGGQRLYSEADIERFNILRRLVEKKYRIGQIAKLPMSDLMAFVETVSAEADAEAGADDPAGEAVQLVRCVDRCIAAIGALDAVALELELSRSVVTYGINCVLSRIIVPLVAAIGEGWTDGTLKIAHEHMASAVIRDFLGSNSRPYSQGEDAPELIVTTPMGQNHELGAVLVATAARTRGWRVTYLAAGLPAVEIVGAAQMRKARAVALSIVFPDDDPMLADELRTIRRLLDDDVKVVVGGRAAGGYHDVLVEIGAEWMSDLDGFYSFLDELRTGQAPSA